MRYQIKEKVIRLSPIIGEPITIELSDDEQIAYIAPAHNYAGIGPAAIVATITEIEETNETTLVEETS